jgi:hypothetical protein
MQLKDILNRILIPKLNENELDNLLDIQTKGQYKPSQQKYVP